MGIFTGSCLKVPVFIKCVFEILRKYNIMLYLYLYIYILFFSFLTCFADLELFVLGPNSWWGLNCYTRCTGHTTVSTVTVGIQPLSSRQDDSNQRKQLASRNAHVFTREKRSHNFFLRMYLSQNWGPLIHPYPPRIVFVYIQNLTSLDHLVPEF